MPNVNKTMRRVGGFCIAMGVVSLVVSITCGVGSLVAGGVLLNKSK